MVTIFPRHFAGVHFKERFSKWSRCRASKPVYFISQMPRE